MCIEFFSHLCIYFHIKRHKLKQIRQNLKLCVYFTNNKYKQLRKQFFHFFFLKKILFSSKLHKTHVNIVVVHGNISFTFQMPKPEIIYFEFWINFVKNFLNTSNIKELLQFSEDGEKQVELSQHLWIKYKQEVRMRLTALNDSSISNRKDAEIP